LSPFTDADFIQGLCRAGEEGDPLSRAGEQPSCRLPGHLLDGYLITPGPGLQERRLLPGQESWALEIPGLKVLKGVNPIQPLLLMLVMAPKRG